MYLDLEDYKRPATVEQCIDLLGGKGSSAIAGGTYLNVRDHERVARLVDLQALPLRGIERVGDAVKVGALVTLSELVDAAGELGPGLGALVEAARGERNLCTRNRSTVGGRLGRRRGDARVATALAALDAKLELLAADGTRTHVGVTEYLTAAAAPHLVLGVSLRADTRASRYASFAPTVMESPVADAALAIAADGTWRLASGGHGPHGRGVVVLAKASALAGDAHADDWRARFDAAALDELPSFADDRGSAEYRRDLSVTLAARLVAAASNGATPSGGAR
ncbi:MAG: FAD binding domain-containing protein [Myxococcales bacterium]|nr:FAD binding domain-containing protein [Myxococcales bacterium]